jgi:hypothetical protein
MALSGIASVGFHASSQSAVQSPLQHKHGGHRSPSISDVDAMKSGAMRSGAMGSGAMGSSVASAPNPTGKIGSKLDVSA